LRYVQADPDIHFKLKKKKLVYNLNAMDCFKLKLVIEIT
jgi:hypothetical protein